MAATDALLEARGLVKRFGGLVATDQLDLSVRRGEIHAVIGPNGAGKTTLIGQLTGELRPDAGTILFDGADVTVVPQGIAQMRGFFEGMAQVTAATTSTVKKEG